MNSNLKNIYHSIYRNINNDNLDNVEETINSEIDLPTGWSFICLDETINYYRENINKTFSPLNQ
uniref:Uncharacterized protein n=1 Tax=Periphykon beckeri TaxID=2006982 RepID=A0A1Z1M3B4_9FLOR|nr:hypothetical protein [Periphykon beckeri]ARW60380.1 hypothetical protein [Periphykon beckeri]